MNKMMVVVVLLGASVAHADEVKDRADKFAHTAASVKDGCGVAIPATYDVRAELSAKRSRAPGTGYEYCESIVSSVGSLCSEAEAKPLVTSKLKSVTCRFEDGISAKVREQSSKTGWSHDFDLKIDHNALVVTFDFNSGNLDSDTAAFLRKALGVTDAQTVKRHQKDFADKVASVQEQCGVKFEATYDLASELTAERGDHRGYGNGYTFCVNVLEGIEQDCSNAKLKAAIAAKLKRVQCKMEHGSSAKMQAKTEKTKVRFTDISMADGVLNVVFDWNTGNVGSETADFLTTLGAADATKPDTKHRR